MSAAVEATPAPATTLPVEEATTTTTPAIVEPTPAAEPAHESSEPTTAAADDEHHDGATTPPHKKRQPFAVLNKIFHHKVSTASSFSLVVSLAPHRASRSPALRPHKRRALALTGRVCACLHPRRLESSSQGGGGSRWGTGGSSSSCEGRGSRAAGFHARLGRRAWLNNVGRGCARVGRATRLLAPMGSLSLRSQGVCAPPRRASRRR